MLKLARMRSLAQRVSHYKPAGRRLNHDGKAFQEDSPPKLGSVASLLLCCVLSICLHSLLFFHLPLAQPFSLACIIKGQSLLWEQGQYYYIDPLCFRDNYSFFQYYALKRGDVWHYATSTPRKGALTISALVLWSHGAPHHPTLFTLHSTVFIKLILYINPRLETVDKTIKRHRCCQYLEDTDNTQGAGALNK